MSRLAKNKNGYTLIEVLVVIAILGIMVSVSSAIFIGTLRSQNKANAVSQARQNAALVIDSFERDVRGASSITPTGSSNQITLTVASDTIVWTCAMVAGENGRITRQRVPDPPVSVTVSTRESPSAVNIVCPGPLPAAAFTVAGGGGSNQIVTLSFTVQQNVASGARADFGTNQSFRTTVGTRVY